VIDTCTSDGLKHVVEMFVRFETDLQKWQKLMRGLKRKIGDCMGPVENGMGLGLARNGKFLRYVNLGVVERVLRTIVMLS